MSSESPPHSTQPVSPLDPSLVRVLQVLDPITRDAGCEYFVAGATARDLVMVHVHGLRPGRATYDIDFGIAVESWDHFARLKERLIAMGDFAADRRAFQRLIYSDPGGGVSLPIDLIPFGGVASGGEIIEWPPSRDIVMNVAGFEEALRSSTALEIAPGFVVRVASLTGMSLLKLVAWSDRGRETDKDAVDLYRLMTSYADAGNTDRIYDTEMDLLEAAGYDMELAGAELLGRDVRGLATPRMLEQIRLLLKSESDFERLVNQIARTTYAEARPAIERAVRSFQRGLIEASVRQRRR
jgi:predicted nucleotidyltransferase